MMTSNKKLTVFKKTLLFSRVFVCCFCLFVLVNCGFLWSKGQYVYLALCSLINKLHKITLILLIVSVYSMEVYYLKILVKYIGKKTTTSYQKNGPSIHHLSGLIFARVHMAHHPEIVPSVDLFIVYK